MYLHIPGFAQQLNSLCPYELIPGRIGCNTGSWKSKNGCYAHADEEKVLQGNFKLEGVQYWLTFYGVQPTSQKWPTSNRLLIYQLLLVVGHG